MLSTWGITQLAQRATVQCCCTHEHGLLGRLSGQQCSVFCTRNTFASFVPSFCLRFFLSDCLFVCLPVLCPFSLSFQCPRECRAISSRRLLPGDVAVLVPGMATCDMILLRGHCLAEESNLSGEVNNTIIWLDQSIPLCIFFVCAMPLFCMPARIAAELVTVCMACC